MVTERRTFKDLVDQLAIEVWKIECADMLIPAADAEQRWTNMPTDGSNPRVTLERIVGCTLIAMKKRGLIDYD